MLYARHATVGVGCQSKLLLVHTGGFPALKPTSSEIHCTACRAGRCHTERGSRSIHSMQTRTLPHKKGKAETGRACSAALLSTLPSVVDPSDAPFVATRVAKPGLPVLRAHGLIAAFDAAENQLSEHVHAAAHAGQLLPPDALVQPQGVHLFVYMRSCWPEL
eukprot:1139322-Pelagomonas_calceolata.AAC.5